jgi:hypothetical protein
MTRTQSIAAAVVLCACVAFPAAAGASQVSVTTSGPSIFPGPGGIDRLVQTNTFTYVSAPGETNALSTVRTASGWTFTDTGATITTTAPQCTVSPDGHQADCTRPALQSAPREILAVAAGDGDDTVTVSWPVAQDLALVESGASLDGGAGDDRVTGGELGDDLRGGAGDDRLDGGAGNDQITGDAGRDTLIGGLGDDLLAARDGEVDIVDCGPGADRVSADAIDALAACETDVNAPTAPVTSPGAPAAAPDRTAPSAGLGLPNRPRRIGTVLRNGVLVTLRASEASTIRVRLHRGSRGRGPGAGSQVTRTLQASGVVRIRVRVSGASRRRHAAQRRTTLTIRAVVTDRAGNRRIVDRALTLRR